MKNVRMQFIFHNTNIWIKEYIDHDTCFYYDNVNIQ